MILFYHNRFHSTIDFRAIHAYLITTFSLPNVCVKLLISAFVIVTLRRPFVPNFLLRDAVGWYLALGVLALLSALFPWELGEEADPFGSAPEGIKPEWYFMYMFQALKLIPPHVFGLEGEMLGVMFFGFCGLIVLLLPFLDRGKRSRRTLNVLAMISVIFIIVMTVWGYLV